MKLLRVSWTLLRSMLHIARGYWTIRTRFSRLPQAEREVQVHAWAGQMLRIAGITLEVRGEVPSPGPVLFVANHISWLDILVMHAAHYCRFISKADIKTWPVVATLSDGAGTLYIERESRRDAHRMVHQMADRLKAGDVLAVFPEGTTGNGVTLKHFHANLVEAAIEAGVPVQPVALQFVDAATGELSFAPRYVDDDTLMQSLWNTLTAPPLRALVTYGAPQLSGGRNRREWAHDLQLDVEALRAARVQPGR
ncbi:MAG: 1-acyl-sn-glycerol-3-phosphate acyltransferase [Comamonadaceae bacterium]|nr:MAG: 1-acyl-sn-glycerol-3-phosphate acyltransferase [Comamonadaceae bacterium]